MSASAGNFSAGDGSMSAGNGASNLGTSNASASMSAGNLGAGNVAGTMLLVPHYQQHVTSTICTCTHAGRYRHLRATFV